MFYEQTLFCTSAWQPANTKPPIDNTIQSHLPENAIIPIKFNRYDSSSNSCCSSKYDAWYHGSTILAAQETIADVPVAKLLSDRRASTVLISEVLSCRELPESEQSDTVKKIFTLLESAKTMRPIYVNILREACRVVDILFRSQDNDEIESEATRALMDAYDVKSVRAVESNVDGLERVQVSLDDLGEEVEETSCAFCMEDFGDGEVMSSPAPDQLCPLCRYYFP